MSEQNSLVLQGYIDRLHDGDAAARDALLAATCERLTELTRKMLKGYPRVRRWEQTDDVLQNALLRLCRALKDVTPPTLCDYYRLATLQIRRELLDLTRHHFGPEGQGVHHASQGGADQSTSAPSPLHNQAETTYDPQELSAWREFHEIAGQLPDEDRVVFDLLWYQGLTQAEAANLLRVSVPTIKRRWLSARLQLQKALHGEAPL